jgi:hypothetical protein
MSPVHYPNWEVSVQLAPSTKYEYKFVKINGSGSVLWESIPNRTFQTPQKGAVTLEGTWNMP